VTNDFIFRHKRQFDASVRTQIVGDGDYYSLEFMDPWLEDTGALGGEFRNHGMSAPFNSVAYDPQNPYNLGVNTPYKGVFLNQAAVPPNPYYSVRAPLITIIDGSTAFFQGWSYDQNYIELEQVGPNPSGYDQKAVIFKQAGAVLTAQYTNSSISQNTTVPAGTYPMAGTLTVASGVTLTLSAGTILEFPSGATFDFGFTTSSDV